MTNSDLVPLYKPDIKGGVRFWSVQAEGNTYSVGHGLLRGKVQYKVTICYPKNVGRSNEVSAEDQAIKAATAKWVRQRDRKGYGITPEEAQVSRKPMLAMDYHKSGHRITYPCGVQPKLDGVRALVERVSEEKVSITSRTGKIFEADLGAIEQWVLENLEVGTILDGELYIHGEELEQIISAVKKTKERTARVEFWVFDLVMEGADNSRRTGILHTGLSPSGPIRLVKTKLVHSEEEMKHEHKFYIAAGFEGTILRNREGLYAYNHRSPDLQKYKDFLDEEFQILDVTEDKDGYPVFLLVCGDGTFTCVLRGDKEENKAKYLQGQKSDVIGKYMTVKYQKKYRDSGLPQFPTGQVIRDYE
jgi:DNA ligase-1